MCTCARSTTARAADPYRESMDYFPTGNYLWRNPIWVNLLGDPTTHAFPLAPPSTADSAPKTDQGVALSWTASTDPDVTGYRVYRAPEGSMDFKPLNAGTRSDSSTFTDTAPVENARYMVRAYGLKEVYAGSFYTFSQGVFADFGHRPISADRPGPRTGARRGYRIAGRLRQGGGRKDICHHRRPAGRRAASRRDEPGATRPPSGSRGA